MAKDEDGASPHNEQLGSVDLLLKKISEGGCRLGPCTEADKAEVYAELEKIQQAELSRAVELHGMLYTG